MKHVLLEKLVKERTRWSLETVNLKCVGFQDLNTTRIGNW